MDAAQKAMSDATLAEADNAGNDGGSATTLDELIELEAEPGVLEQAEAEEAEPAEDTEDSEAAETEEEAEEAEDEEETEDEDSLTDEEKAALKQATTERIERKIGKAHAKRKEAEERAEAAEQERNELATRVAELEASLEAVDVNAAAAQSGVSDLYLVESEAALEKRRDELAAGVDALEDWLDSNERDDMMVTGSGTEYSWADVKAQKRALQRRLERDVPQARKMLERRTAATAQARKLYPNLFKTTSAEHQEMQTLLRTVPGLRAHPDARLLIGRMLSGKAIEGKSSVRAAAKPKPKPTAPKPPDSATPSAKRAGRALMKHDPRKVQESGSWDDLV